MRSTTVPAAVLGAVTLVLALTGCGSSTKGAISVDTNAPGAVSTDVSSSSLARSTVATSSRSAGVAATIRTPSASTRTPAAAGCPVTAAVLTAAAKSSIKVDHAVIIPTSVRCYRGWAVAKPDLPGSDGILVFRFDTADHRWTAVAQGSSLTCSSIGISQEVGTRLQACSAQG